MKSIKKFLFVMVALATALAFVSCNNDDDEPSVVAVYKAEEDGYTATFFDDNTWTLKLDLNDTTVASGTYTGDPSKDSAEDNKVVITPKTYYKDGSLESIPDDHQEGETLPIKEGKFVYSGETYTLSQ
ncbi:MAG: hypothetical protein K2M50_10635 [Treponemataceae bacterium]|nr:hypothetical protein [Treponemataceae bacterium]